MFPSVRSSRLAALLVLSACTAAPPARRPGPAIGTASAAAEVAVAETEAPPAAVEAVVAPSRELQQAPAVAPEARPKKSEPWRLSKALDLPKWLRLSGSQRTRYEYLWNQFRSGLSGDDDIWALRTTLRADLIFSPVEGTFEVMDARAYGANEDETSLDTTTVNALEIIQAYVGVRLEDLFGKGNEGFVLAGRHTMDIGSRRLVARNDFRNTTNNFTGLNATCETDSGGSYRAFATVPVNRLPTDFDSLEDNEIRSDEEADDTYFFGAYASQTKLFSDVSGELFWYYLDEDDTSDELTRDRQLHTPGLRVYEQPAQSEFDFEIEAAYQFGDSRTSTTSTTDLDHSAHFEHAEVGYSFAGDLSPRLVAQFDYASGDDNPNDDENNRFDTLFGARRFDFGPTGIYGPFARSNIISPGLRLHLQPSEKVDVMLADRFYWLASDTDAWTTTGIRDAAGDSGNYLGNMPEVRVHWHIVPKSFVLDGGFAYVFAGGFIEDAPGSNGEDSAYAYMQSTLTF